MLLREPHGDYQYAINNSFGFGGHNVALALGATRRNGHRKEPSE